MSSYLDELRHVDVVLDQLNHTFRIGIIGFGALGRAIFCSSLEWPHSGVVAVNDPFVTAEHAAELLQQDQYRDYLSDVEIKALSLDKFSIRKGSKSRIVRFSAEEDLSQINWKSLENQVLHVIECSGKFNTRQEASRHLHTAMSYSQEVEYERNWGTDAPKFWPDVALPRDGSVASQLVSNEEGGGHANLPEGKSNMAIALERALSSNLSGAEPRDEMEEYFVEAANSAYIDVVSACDCCAK
ncbi:hypothetical protein CBER1_00084 [Cercospora berteroae]|uniref:Glyceraldehyde 3-phosphate dehydrogenase NAD(P) binding domain-containing protein n=1 Tax=Cercospora berteroae TaxID=357750 RepID=A0A2S6CDC9_9PEZI|nr:hypothetical protein CBER1_00084 [Cercospora berteroae]